MIPLARSAGPPLRKRGIVLASQPAGVIGIVPAGAITRQLSRSPGTGKESPVLIALKRITIASDILIRSENDLAHFRTGWVGQTS